MTTDVIMEDATPEEVGELADDGEWYLSPTMPREVQLVTQAMADAGEDDESIGQLVRHHFKDYGEDRGLGVLLVRHSEKPGIYGVIALVPNTEYFTDLNDHDFLVVDDYQCHVRSYELPDAPEFLDVLDDELLKRGWREVVVSEKLTSFGEALRNHGQFHSSGVSVEWELAESNRSPLYYWSQ